MRWFINYLRQSFCKHDFEKEENELKQTSFGEIVKSGIRVSLICKKCGYHKSFWKFQQVPGILNTFGSSEAAETLVKMIGSDKKLLRKVGSFFADYNRTMKSFEEMMVSNGHIWKNLIHLYTNDRFAASRKILGETVGGSYLRNIMTPKKRHLLSLATDIINIEKKAKKRVK